MPRLFVIFKIKKPLYVKIQIIYYGVNCSVHSGSEILPFILSLLNLLNIASISTESGNDLSFAVLGLTKSLYLSIILLTSLLVIYPLFSQSICSNTCLSAPPTAYYVFTLTYSIYSSISISLRSVFLNYSLVSNCIWTGCCLDSNSSLILRSRGKRALENSRKPSLPS